MRASDTTHRISHARKAVAGGWIGSALEYYDFFIYATAASLVFPQIFFPAEDPGVAIVASLATYGVGYVARPVGAFVLGHWGDTHGRTQVLVTCMVLMGVSTMGVGLLPTYEQAGVLAPTLLVVLRLIQGFAVAGEISGSSSMILEHAPFGHRGLYSSFTLQGVQAGQIVAAAVFLPLARYMPAETFIAWGWRVPFLFSAFVVAAGYVIRRRVPETPVFASSRPGTRPAHRDPGLHRSLGRSVARRVHGADECDPRDYHLWRGICRPARLRHPDAGRRLPLDPDLGQLPRRARHPVCRSVIRSNWTPSADRGRLARGGPALVRLSLRDQYPTRAAGHRRVAGDVGRGLPGLQRRLPELLP